MAIQYMDGSFSESMPISEATQRFLDCLKNNEPVQALHVGTLPELEKKRRNFHEQQNVLQQLEEIKNRVAELEKHKIINTSEILHIPTPEETVKYNGK